MESENLQNPSTIDSVIVPHLGLIPEEPLATISITTYAELKPYIEEVIRVLEEVYEVGKSRGEENLLKNMNWTGQQSDS